MRIIIVDDNPHHSELAARRLMKENWEVFVTDNPEPVEQFKNYDLVVLDYSMPHICGLDVLNAIKEREILTPTVLLTGHGNETIASEAIKQGAYDYVIKDTQLLYLERLPSIIREAKSKHELIETNRYLINELKRANEKLQQMTFTDEMTGIHNYRFIRKQLEIETKRASRYNKPLSVCVVDIDHFKRINDLHGHPVGDDALREIAAILREQTRTVDVVGRYAGDEFVVIFPDTTLSDAVRLCERIRKRVSEHVFLSHGIEMQCTLSIGVADFEPHKRKTPDQLLEAADKCLYQAKRSGRDRVGSLLRVIEKNPENNVIQLNT